MDPSIEPLASLPYKAFFYLLDVLLLTCPMIKAGRASETFMIFTGNETFPGKTLTGNMTHFHVSKLIFS